MFQQERVNERWIVANTAADLAAWTDMDNEAAAAPGTIREVTGIHFSSAATSSFAVRATNGTAIAAIYPPSGQPANVAAGHVIDTDIVKVLLDPGWRLQWQSPAGGATAREVGARVVPRQYAGPGA